MEYKGFMIWINPYRRSYFILNFKEFLYDKYFNDKYYFSLEEAKIDIDAFLQKNKTPISSRLYRRLIAGLRLFFLLIQSLILNILK